MALTLAQQMVRTLSIFQALVALPIMLGASSFAMRALGYPDFPLYDFISATFVSFFAAGIIFVVWVQRNSATSRKVILYFEIAKSSLATGIWLWLILDAAFGPWTGRYYRPYPRKPLVIRAAISVIVLFIFYYPSLIWAFIDKPGHGEAVAGSEDEEAQDEAGEREPLLRQGGER